MKQKISHIRLFESGLTSFRNMLFGFQAICNFFLNRCNNRLESYLKKRREKCPPQQKNKAYKLPRNRHQPPCVSWLCNRNRSMSSYCTDSESLPRMGLKPTPASVSAQETRSLTNYVIQAWSLGVTRMIKCLTLKPCLSKGHVQNTMLQIICLNLVSIISRVYFMIYGFRFAKRSLPFATS